ncbi:unnamed protein product, partial [marine sediment metagenome]
MLLNSGLILGITMRMKITSKIRTEPIIAINRAFKLTRIGIKRTSLLIELG